MSRKGRSGLAPFRIALSFVAGFAGSAAVAQPAATDDTDAQAFMQVPVPRPLLAEPGAAAQMSEPKAADAVLGFDPALAALGRANSSTTRSLRASPALPVDIVRRGFAAQDGLVAPADRSVGFTLGRDVLSLSTTLTSPAQPGASRQASIGWNWAVPAATGAGLIWGIGTGGSRAIGGNLEQTGAALLGYRRQILPYLMLSSQLGMEGQYIFAAGDGFHSALTPELKLSLDLAKAIDLPSDASLDFALARKLPLVASDVETRGTAMVSFSYKLP